VGRKKKNRGKRGPHADVVEKKHFFVTGKRSGDAPNRKNGKREGTGEQKRDSKLLLTRKTMKSTGRDSPAVG